MTKIISYDDIQDVNSAINYTDTDEGKYAKVTEKVIAFRRLFPGGFIKTRCNGNDVFTASVGYYEGDNERILATGSARMKPTSDTNISPFERAETAAVGRALSFLGIGIDNSICSLDELDDAVRAMMNTHVLKLDSEVIKPNTTIPKPIGMVDFLSDDVKSSTVEEIQTADGGETANDGQDTKPESPATDDVEMITPKQKNLITKYYGKKLDDFLSKNGLADIDSVTFEDASEIIKKMVSVG